MRLPMNGPALGEKEREKPQMNHWIETMESESIDRKMSDSAFLCRASPE